MTWKKTFFLVISAGILLKPSLLPPPPHPSCLPPLHPDRVPVLLFAACSPARRRAKSTQHILTKSVRKISLSLPVVWCFVLFFFFNSSWLHLSLKMLWINGKCIFQGTVHRCLMQGVGRETEKGVSVKVRFVYRSPLKLWNKKYSLCRAGQNEHSSLSTQVIWGNHRLSSYP